MTGRQIVDVAYGEGWDSGRGAVLGPIEDERLLREGEFYGFGVDMLVLHGATPSGPTRTS
ncbi:hypothetical protein [Streptomyces sp. NPDC086766]|uniref:hypothetical protein n=1 Tax=Streptomyces sp. NPDC086766 TaxID=3365754 RepID=UPI003820D693